MAAPSCSECGGMRWVRYFSETMDGDFEEAFRLCHCNYESETRGERVPEESEHVAQTRPESWPASPLDRDASNPVQNRSAGTPFGDNFFVRGKRDYETK